MVLGKRLESRLEFLKHAEAWRGDLAELGPDIARGEVGEAASQCWGL